MTSAPAPSIRSARWTLVGAFLALYLFWGSTYLAIKVVVTTLPPLGSAGLRFLIAGTLLYGILRLRGVPAPERAHWRPAAIAGALLILGGNALVTLAVQWIDSGLAAVLVATMPIYLTLFGWWSGMGRRPGWVTGLGLATGLLGIVVLLDPSLGGPNLLAGMGLALLAPMLWAVGTLYGKRSVQPGNALLFAAMQMLIGGALTLAVSFAIFEPSRISWAGGSLLSWLAFLYLIVFGALVGFSAFVYVTKHTSPAASSSYAYVNPVVAVFLGHLLLGELLSQRVLLGSALTLGAVALILWRNTRKLPARA